MNDRILYPNAIDGFYPIMSLTEAELGYRAESGLTGDLVAGLRDSADTHCDCTIWTNKVISQRINGSRF